jgi:hypothetical protein
MGVDETGDDKRRQNKGDESLESIFNISPFPLARVKVFHRRENAFIKT